MCCVAWRYRTESTGDLQGLVPQVPFIMEKTLPEWGGGGGKGELRRKDRRAAVRDFRGDGFFSLHHISPVVKYVNDF